MQQPTAVPTIYEHLKFPAWGRGVAFAEHPDRRDFIFEDGATRVFKNEGSPLVPVALPGQEAVALGQALHKKRPPAPAAKKKTSARKATPRHVVPETLTFQNQLDLFLATFPQGFADPKFIAQERGTGTNAGKEPARERARELLARPRLEAHLAAGEHAQIFDAAWRLVSTTRNMLHPTFEANDFRDTRPATYEAFARALVALLHGDGPVAPRFDAFATSLATKRPYWTLATVFSALSRPQESFFAKPKWEQQQARILGMEEPPSGVPTHAGYLLYAAVGTAVRDRLVAAGQTPRDLLDVYSFIWRTLSDSAVKVKKPRAPKAPKAPKEAKAPVADVSTG